MSFELASVAPRLARARDQHEADIAARWQYERLRTMKLLEAERVLAHRELQLVRAFATGRGRYIRYRQDKLAEAQRKVERWSK